MTLTREEAGTKMVDAIDRFIEAGNRRGRKPRDVNSLYTSLRQELKLGWEDQARAFMREWRTRGIANTFEAKRKGPSDKQMDALWNRAKKKGDARHVKAVDRNSKEAVDRGGKSALKDLQVGSGIEISFDLDHPQAVKFLKKRGAERVAGISNTSRDRIKRLVVDMANSGKSYGEIGRAIEKEIKGWAKRGTGAVTSRGELIAVTEVGESYEEGRRIVRDEFTKAGLKSEKTWMDVADDRVCPDICMPAVEDGWIPSGDQFSNGLDTPLGHPGCRCDLGLQVVA